LRPASLKVITVAAGMKEPAPRLIRAASAAPACTITALAANPDNKSFLNIDDLRH